MGRTKARRTTYEPSLVSLIERAVYRLRNTNGLALQPIGDGGDPEVVLHACNEKLTTLTIALRELAAAIEEQVGPSQTDRLTRALRIAKATLRE